jgi:hypothetical protein
MGNAPTARQLQVTSSLELSMCARYVAGVPILRPNFPILDIIYSGYKAHRHPPLLKSLGLKYKKTETLNATENIQAELLRWNTRGANVVVIIEHMEDSIASRLEVKPTGYVPSRQAFGLPVYTSSLGLQQLDNSRLFETLMQVSVKVPGCWCPSPKDIFMGLLI